MQLVVGCIETYKKEAFGILAGRRRGKDFVVRHAISYQTATRDYEFTSIDVKREKRINYALKRTSAHKLIGDFHSHAGGFEKLSKSDIKELKEAEPNFVSLLVIINKKKKPILWKYKLEDRSISGSIGRFRVKIKAFIFNKKKNKIEKLIIKCPYIQKVNKKTKHYEKLKKKYKKVEKESRKKLLMKRKLKKLLK